MLYWHLPHVGQLISSGFAYKPRAERISFAAIISLTGSSVKDTLIVSPIPLRRRCPIAIDDLIDPE